MQSGHDTWRGRLGRCQSSCRPGRKKSRDSVVARSGPRCEGAGSFGSRSCRCRICCGVRDGHRWRIWGLMARTKSVGERACRLGFFRDSKAKFFFSLFLDWGDGWWLPSGSYCKTCKLQSLSETTMYNLLPSGRNSADATSRYSGSLPKRLIL